MNKNEIILKITILSVIAICLTLFMIDGMNERVGFDFMSREKISGNPIYTKEYEKEEVKYIDINNISADVFIYQSKDNRIKVEIYGRKKDFDKYEVGVTEETLKIKQGKMNNFCIGFCSLDQRIVLYLPDTYIKDMKIYSVSGDIITKKELAANLDLQTVSGDIEIESAKLVKAKTTSGDIDIRKVGDVSLEAISGDISIRELALTKKATIHTVSGDVDIEKTNDIYVTTKTVSGDVKIGNNNRYADIELNVTTTSGDIDIN